MSDRFAALAGFPGGSADETAASATDASALRTGLPGLDSEDSISLGGGGGSSSAPLGPHAINQPPKRPTLSPLRRASTPLGPEAAAPQQQSGKPSEGGPGATTPRQREQARRRYGVRITDDEEAIPDDVEDSLDDSEAELQRVRRDLSRSHAETTFDDDDESASAPPLGGGVGSGGGRGGAASAAAMGRRSAAGISLKDAEAKMRKLEAENNELKIEIDIYRQNMTPTESQNRVVSLMKERQVLKRKEAQFGQVLREQDKVIRENKKKLKRWGDRDPIRETEEKLELERSLREAQAQVQEERQARERADDEIDFLKRRNADVSSASAGGGGGGDHLDEVERLRRMLDDQRDDHEEALYELRRERDDYQARIEELEAGEGSRADQSSRSMADGAEARRLRRELQDAEQDLARAQTENEQVVKRLDEMQQGRSDLDQELERLRDELQASQSAEDALQRELDVAKRRLEHVHSERDDVEQRIRDAEDAVAERLGAQNDRLRDELAAAKLETQERTELVEQLEVQRDEDDTRMADVEYELQQANAALEEKDDQLDALNRDLDALEYDIQKMRQDAEERELLIGEFKEDLKARDADLSETNRELQEVCF